VRYVKGTSTQDVSVVKACESAFFADLAVTVTASAVIVATLLADNGTPLVSDVADVALVVDVVFADVALDADAGGTEIFIYFQTNLSYLKICEGRGDE
jgi:hypothetical protein